MNLARSLCFVALMSAISPIAMAKARTHHGGHSRSHAASVSGKSHGHHSKKKGHKTKKPKHAQQHKSKHRGH